MPPERPVKSSNIEDRIDPSTLTPEGQLLYNLLATVKRNRAKLETKRESQEMEEIVGEWGSWFELNIERLKKTYPSELVDIAVNIFRSLVSNHRVGANLSAVAAKSKGYDIEQIGEIFKRLCGE